jgi:hypothetical protein
MYQPELLGGGENPSRRDDHTVAVGHLQLQLVPDDLAAGQVDDRLSV